MTMEEMSGLNVGAERIDAQKTLVCDGFQQTYYMNGSHFEIIPPPELGEGSCRSLLSRGSVQLTDFNLMFTRDMDASGEIRTPRTELVFCLGEGIEWGTSLEGSTFRIDTGEMALLHGGERGENCRYHRNAGYRFLSMDMSPEHYDRLTAALSGDERLRSREGKDTLFAKSRITPAIRPILAQIAECSYGPGIRELYLEGKMLELFAVYLNESLYQEEKVPGAVRLSKEDMQCLHLARTILQRDYVNPPTLAGLARLICLNEFKLKKGFKEMFGSTVHAYVIELRLQQAYRLLCEGGLSVSETAYRVGYGNVSHFAAAFRKRFGTSPGEYAMASRRQDSAAARQ
ncbi:AraC family transcriptional regulator [Paenibacillus sp. MMS20-IR301]|uniref:helix-turn-helix transcriptional regulator n=1 Tax=Paenibacillus sp. MMS20-IR301 TaxID=2895946 RepID=UPI0028E88478|nr:AraC family transcriptional regulator [Paenibacillus sp. MMS20-IR301]WNS43762.1 AraC family transcriptional regulator [Paenibacillus sp. MMS20-IR301]